ncbi:8556_t:CDS:2 [Ambispora gerdemannii]|uniref:8556_t:CDS:1 n=1 Tax=Ambispora gerdemannii TaxID=144530 RepID=A0A9N9FMJ9_9GLOM|nr:8556_t:CDS:2 [Ambispora gerdemannii]
MSEKKSFSIGREPNSAVVFHALPRHDFPVDIKDLARENTKEEHWQDKEHIVHPSALNDPKGIVGQLQKDWERGVTEESEESHKKLKKDARSRDDTNKPMLN